MDETISQLYTLTRLNFYVAMAEIDCCPSCGSGRFKQNGHIHNGKQNHQCKSCGRQFALNPENKLISPQTKTLIKKALLERGSLRGIYRVFDVSLTWLLSFITSLYEDFTTVHFFALLMQPYIFKQNQSIT
jgi:transposase-like protein